jgi:hypothetical protein
LNIGLTDKVLCFVLRNDQAVFEGTQLQMGLLFTNLRHGMKLGTGLKWPEMEPSIQNSRELLYGFQKANNLFPGKENGYHLTKNIS